MKFREKAREALAKGRAIQEKARKEERELTSEESAAVDQAFDDSEAYLKKARAKEAREEKSQKLNELLEKPVRMAPRGDGGGEAKGAASGNADSGPTVRLRATGTDGAPLIVAIPEAALKALAGRGQFRLIEGGHGVREGKSRFAESLDFVDARETAEEAERKAAQHRALIRHVRGGEAFARASAAELKELTSMHDPSGGYWLSEDWRSDVIQRMRDMVFIRQRATVISTTAKAVSFPTFDYDGDIPITDEGQQISIEDISDLLGKTSFEPKPRKVIYKVPAELLEDAGFPIVSFLNQHFAMRFGEIEEADFLLGDGKKRPLGILVAKLGAERDLTSAGAAGAIDPDDVYDTIYSLKAQYRRNATWTMNRQTIRDVRKLRDDSGGAGTGNYLWQPGLAPGQPATLGGYAIDESEYFPVPAQAGDFNWLFGDWSHYWIVDRTGIAVQRLDELYAEEDKTGIKMKRRSDGAPTNAEAFSRMARQ